MALQAHGITTGTVAEVEANSNALRVVVMPENGGSYAKKMTSGTMAAGLAAASNICHFRNTCPGFLCLIRRVDLVAGNAGTAFAAGVCSFRLFPARFVTGAPTTGLNAVTAANAGKLRTSAAAMQFGTGRSTVSTTIVPGLFTISSTAAIATTAATLDSDPIASITQSVAGVAGEIILPAGYPLIEFRGGRYPLICAEWEGFSIQATVPATGTWSFSVTVEWEEVPIYP